MPGKSVPGKGSLAPEVLLDQPFSAAGTGWEVTLCQRRPQQCHLPPGPRGPQDALPRPSSGEPPGSSTLAPGLVQAMPRREVAVPGGIGAEAVAFSALALCLLLCDGPQRRRRWRRRRGQRRVEDAALGTQLDGAPRAGGPPPRPPSRESPRRSEKFRMGPPEGARGRGRGRGGNRGARLGPLPVGPAPRGCDWGPRVGWVARDSGLRGAGRSVEPDSGG
ncbi:translation initiation factor IF-2-like isoform X2 [Prionailurus viverrinus]|uniref:translation initiation factor IF-2-like isoform X2 n=1 Tax=Prionailurus viverrinus TaxID=61388 RepID=UPI001FF5979E|nr:translation initiation factor IF-2-like isoform X2 [Prionailurus viverrinus]